MKRNMTCIICPKGCLLMAEICDDAVSVTGNSCPKGREYAISECLHPMRTVTTVVRVVNRTDTMVSVKTARPVPKEKMVQVVAALRSMRVKAPVAVGDVLCENICGSAIVVTKTVL
ncbi:MAG: DUF1667 domain-containing protein [Ruminococcaceae bacterium]|nr:DUF1667 domain-containing protein [Oscillospiraceae bacterium]